MKGFAIIFGFCLLFVKESSFCADPPASSEQDADSGKTVVDLDMAYRVMSQRVFNAPRVGERAPAFELVRRDTGGKVTLAELHAEKPVVLFFGSYGCNVMRDGIDDLARLYNQYGDRFAFVLVYIREAHSLNGFDPSMARGEDPKTLEERIAIAGKCRVALEVPFPILIDSMDDRTATRWGAWPIRTFVVDTTGRVVYAADAGPPGFRPGGNFVPFQYEGLGPHPEYSQETLEDFFKNFGK